MKGLKLRISIFILSLFLFLSGCSQNSSGKVLQEKSNGPVEITINIPRDTTGTVQKIVDEFNRTHKDIKVKYVQSPASADEAHDTFATYLSSRDSSIDIYYLDVIWTPEFAEADWAQPLDKFISKEDKKDFLPSTIEAFTYKGQLIAIPYMADGGMLYYRKDLLEREGLTPPKTWDDLVRQAKLLQNKYGIYGMTFQAAQYEGLVCDFLEYVWGNGGDILDKKGRIVVNKPEAVEALGFMKGLISKEKIAPKSVLSYQEDESLQVFTEGKAAFHRNWSYAWGIAQDKGSKIKGKVGVIPMPHASGKEGMPVSTIGAQGFMISKFSKHPKEAWEVLKYLTSFDTQKKLLLGAGYVPTRLSVYKDQEVKEKHPFVGQQLKIYQFAKPRPVHPFYPEISDVLQVQVHKALLGKVSSQEALDKAAKEIQDIIERTP